MKNILFIAVLFVVSGTMAQNISTTEKGVEINGIIWATRNVGEKGKFVDAITQKGKPYTWADAKNACPTGWRLPTKREFKKLLRSPKDWKYRALTYTNKDAVVVQGMQIYNSKNEKECLFFPGEKAIVRTYTDGTTQSGDAYASFWSSSCSILPKDSHYVLYFETYIGDDRRIHVNRSELKVTTDNNRYVRCVKDKQKAKKEQKLPNPPKDIEPSYVPPLVEK